MNRLTQLKCVPCRSGAPTLTEAEIAELHLQTPEWQVVERNGTLLLERIFEFNNFLEAVAFTNQVAVIAEEQGHHPLIVTEWGRVTVQWWTHIIKGLHKNDFVMAAKTDELVR